MIELGNQVFCRAIVDGSEAESNRIGLEYSSAGTVSLPGTGQPLAHWLGYTGASSTIQPGGSQMTEDDVRNMNTVRQMYAGTEAERASIARDIVWHVPGHNPVSGDYHGFEAYTRTMAQRMAPLTRWDFTLKSVAVNGAYVMTTFHLSGERRGRHIDTDGGHLMRLTADGHVAEGWGFTEKQDELDAFFEA
jgi:ketosteroid isomerase-like protein